MESFRCLVEFLKEKLKNCVIVFRQKIPYTIGVATKYNVKGKKYMNIRLGEKLKSLRREKNISQEKLAQFLNVSFQAVSKWENGSTYPDIELLPEIARFFGITVDALLQAEQIDEKRLYTEYDAKSAEAYLNGKISAALSFGQEAYRRLPNNIEVQEMLMSTYFDMDMEKYQKEIVALGTEIYAGDAPAYCKGQAIWQIARTYAACGDMEMAKNWASRADSILHAKEMLFVQIVEDGEEMLSEFRFANYWYLNKLFYMSARIADCKSIPGGTEYVQAVSKAVTRMYELVFADDDMNFEDLQRLCMEHRSIAEDETTLGNNEKVVRYHLTRALACAQKSVCVKEHEVSSPLVKGWHVCDAPSDNKQVVRQLLEEVSWNCFDEYRSKEWYLDMEGKLKALL